MLLHYWSVPKSIANQIVNLTPFQTTGSITISVSLTDWLLSLQPFVPIVAHIFPLQDWTSLSYNPAEANTSWHCEAKHLARCNWSHSICVFSLSSDHLSHMCSGLHAARSDVVAYIDTDQIRFEMCAELSHIHRAAIKSDLKQHNISSQACETKNPNGEKNLIRPHFFYLFRDALCHHGIGIFWCHPCRSFAFSTWIYHAIKPLTFCSQAWFYTRISSVKMQHIKSLFSDFKYSRLLVLYQRHTL